MSTYTLYWFHILVRQTIITADGLNINLFDENKADERIRMCFVNLGWNQLL